MWISSNTNMHGVQESIRQGAMESFEYCANTVLVLGLPEDLCLYVQDVVRDQEDVLLHTKRPRALLMALSAWLSSRGVAVLTSVNIPEHEILKWLEMDQRREGSLGASLDLRPEGVALQWL